MPLYVASDVKPPKPETLGRLAEERFWRRYNEERHWERENDREWGFQASHWDTYRRRPWHPEYSRFDDEVIW